MNIAVSSCLLGEPCRFDGRPCACEEAIELQGGNEVLALCPEVLGGLSVPRPACEVVLSERALRVVDSEACEATGAFLDGASKALALAQEKGCTLAVLKARSPSCGSGEIYDGSFSGALAPGYGVTARAFRAAGLRVIDEDQLRGLLARNAALHPGEPPAILATKSSECPALSTARLVLRPLRPDDAAEVFAYASDPDIGPDCGWEPHRDETDSRAFIEGAGAQAHSFGIFEKLDGGCDGRLGPCIGSIGLACDARRRNVDGLMLGYALAKWAWGRGLMSEAAREVIRYGFEELGLSQISCAHYPFNRRSRRVIEKCGFVREGTLHAAAPAPNGFMQDMEAYVLQAQEWRRLRKLEDRSRRACR